MSLTRGEALAVAGLAPLAEAIDRETPPAWSYELVSELARLAARVTYLETVIADLRDGATVRMAGSAFCQRETFLDALPTRSSSGMLGGRRHVIDDLEIWDP